ncbi:hypothetical protein [Microcystis phage Mel-JY01]
MIMIPNSIKHSKSNFVLKNQIKTTIKTFDYVDKVQKEFSTEIKISQTLADVIVKLVQNSANDKLMELLLTVGNVTELHRISSRIVLEIDSIQGKINPHGELYIVASIRANPELNIHILKINPYIRVEVSHKKIQHEMCNMIAKNFVSIGLYPEDIPILNSYLNDTPALLRAYPNDVPALDIYPEDVA